MVADCVVTAALAVPEFVNPPPIKFKNPAAVLFCPTTIPLLNPDAMFPEPPPTKESWADAVLPAPQTTELVKPVDAFANPPPKKDVEPLAT
jgi:hypothetical protein